MFSQNKLITIIFKIRNISSSVLLTLLFLSVACSEYKGDDNPVDVINEDELNQEFLAKDSEDGTVTFDAIDIWHASIKETTANKQNTPDWITLDAYDGVAGINTLKISVKPNYSGVVRYASIYIECKGKTNAAIIKVTQSNEDKDGNILEYPKGQISRLTKEITDNGDDDGGIEIHETIFNYDSENRLVSLKMKDEPDGINIVYSENIVTCTKSDELYAKVELNARNYIESGESNEKFITDMNGNGIYKEVIRNMEWSVSYDDDGYIVNITGEIELFETDEPELTKYTTDFIVDFEWDGGNLIKARWTSDSNPDEWHETVASYDASENRGVFDINWLVYRDECFSVISKQIFGFMGYYGKRSDKLVVETVTTGYNSAGYSYNFEYLFNELGYVTQWSSANETNKITHR